MKKHKLLGKISGLSHFLHEYQENETKIGSESIFNLVYESYKKLTIFGDKTLNKESILYIHNLKNNKRNARYWLSFWKGVIF